MQTMIGVMGSVAGFTVHASEIAFELGQAIARQQCTLVTGACPGLPYDAVRGAKEAGGLTVGISPGHNYAEHTLKYISPTEGFDVIIYTGSGLMGREITGIRSCDIVVLVGGRSGTLGEFAIAYDEGKLIGVLTGTGGIADHIPALVEVIAKDTGAQIIYDDDPWLLISKLVEIYKSRFTNCQLEVALTEANNCRINASASAEELAHAITIMEQEIQTIQANISEQRQRLSVYRDLAVLGPVEKG